MSDLITDFSKTVPAIVISGGKERRIMPNQKVFESEYGVYNIHGEDGLFIPICAQRDILEHRNKWRMMAQDGSAIWVDKNKVYPHKKI